MFDYNKQVRAYEDEKVRVSKFKRDDLYSSRDANRNRLKKNLPENVRINDKHFIEQGSMAAQTIIQEKDGDYDIDDGVWFYSEDLVNDDGSKKSAKETQEMVLEAIKKNHPFKKAPKIIGNAVRVFYDEGYHVDIPSFRKLDADKDTERLELAGVDGWAPSDPSEINRWFLKKVEDLNTARDDSGSQWRRCIRLAKRFARSRGEDWDMPNGLKLTMLADECFPTSYARDDEAFYRYLSALKTRLATNLEVENRAQTGTRDKLTKGTSDANMVELRKRVGEAVEKLKVIESSSCTKKAAREAWDWVFQSDGFFETYDTDDEADAEERGIAESAPSTAAVKTASRFG